MSKPEVILWSYLRGGQLGASFRKQHPVGPYFVDFYCASLKLAIEIDGSQHALQGDYDRQRTKFLKEKGVEVIRFHAVDVLSNVEGVGYAIKSYLSSRT